MATSRAVIRAVVILLLSLASYVPLLVGRLLLRPLPLLYRGWQMAISRGWSLTVARILGMRVEVKGTPPQSPFILVCNHLSYLDIVLLFTQVHGTFIAKQEVSRWPIFGFLARAANTLFIDRTNYRDIPRVNRLMAREIRVQGGIILFPEGTSSSGMSVLPFRPPLLDFPASDEIPVSYGALHYRTEPGDPPAEDLLCWHGAMTFADHFWKILKLERFSAVIAFGDQPIVAKNRKELAARLHNAVLSIFQPTTAENTVEAGDAR